MQTEIAESIAKTLLNELTPEKKSKLAVSKPASVEAYEYYLRGIKVHLDKYFTTGNEDYFKESERYLLKAISLDPAYADAYGALADLYDTRSNFTTEKKKYYGERDSLALIGYRLNPNSIQTLIALFWSQLKRETPNHDSAFYYLKKAYHVDSEDIKVSRVLGDFYVRVSMKESCEKFTNKSIAKSPLDVSALFTLSSLYLKYDDLDLFMKYANKIIELDSNNLPIHYLLLFTYTTHKKIAEAKREFEIIKKIKPDFHRMHILEGYILAAQGNKEEALKKDKDINVYMLLGMKNEFLTELNKQSINLYSPEELKTSYYDFVRNEPAFKDFQKRLKVDYEKRLAKYGTLE